ncbi:MAG TPA: FAD binding domain-containing protein [Mesorhizobium sp.]|jgi:CO/xanthine dehydrogenase FAD-binding subunit|nr:FAD binding domain-containing protein [Mesorhizobium sp.]
MAYVRPQTLDEALGLMASGRWTQLAGGTDVFPARAGKPLPDDVLDLGALGELERIEEPPEYWAIGAGVTWAAIQRAKLPPAFFALQAAAREVGAVQVQNRATLGGNLCNASPAADGVPALLVLDAEVELRSRSVARRLRLEEFILGNRRTARRPDELLTRILVPKASASGGTAFQKLGARRYLVISIAMCAARLALDEGGRVSHAAVAVGACSPVAQRLPALERDLLGRPAHREALAALPDPARHFAELSPIGDVRAAASYRRVAAAEIVRRALAEAAGRLDAPCSAAA